MTPTVADLAAHMITEIEREQRNLANLVTAMAAHLITETESYLRGQPS